VAATRLQLSAGDLQQIGAAVASAALAGQRFGGEQMRQLDSERAENG
jgi:hypothetical protein